MFRRLAVIAILLAAVPAIAQPPKPKPMLPQPTERGQKMLDAYFRRRVKEIADKCLTDLTTKEDWEKRRPELRRQFLDMVGLWPLPERTDLKAAITGKVERDTYVVEKLHFQSKPGLYVTGNVYVPKNAKKLPAVLYVCGHGNVVENGVSYGSKVRYQHHPAWFAQNGYVCLILDTLELGEIPGEHHGTSRRGMWWWQSLGYTPAGVECWNAMRALDYLETRPEVDPNRLGVTGRSGGGATSWWVAAADDRVQCIIPVAGIADLHAHLIDGESERYKNGVLPGHCDCMYMVNTYQWDFPMVAAMCAPRPLLLGNSDKDLIFPVGGYRRLADKVRKVYDLYGAGDKFQLLETKGPHQDTPELRLGAFKWMNRWLKNDTSEVVEKPHAPFKPQELKVFDKLPADALNPKIHESFVKPANPPLPKDKAEWERMRAEWMTALKEEVFRNWPKNPPPLAAKVVADIRKHGMRLRSVAFTSEADVELRVWVITQTLGVPNDVRVNMTHEIDWQSFLALLGPDFSEAFPGEKLPTRDAATGAQFSHDIAGYRNACVVFPPRGIGATRFAAPGSVQETLIRRRFALIGQTLEAEQAWDVFRALQAIKSVDDLKSAGLLLSSDSEIALVAAIFEPRVMRLRLKKLSASYRGGSSILNLTRQLDTPQLLALALPNHIELTPGPNQTENDWVWTRSVERLLNRRLITIYENRD